MDFESRNLQILQLLCLSVILTASFVLFTAIQSNLDEGNIKLEVKTTVIKPTPKANFIPPAKNQNFKADISNAIINPKTRRPVVFSI